MRIVLTPDWFIGKDMLIECFSFLVLVIFSILAIRNYKISKNRKSLYLGVGFGFIALAQLASLFTKFFLYYDLVPTHSIGQALITSNLVNSVDVFYYAGFFFYRLMTLAGFFMIYRLPRDKKSWGDYALVLYFILVSALLSKEFYYLFHLTALVLLILIVGNYYDVLKEHKLFNTKILVTAFSLLALSQLIFALSRLEVMFVLANVIELVSYCILLGLGIRLLQNGKEKKPNGYHIGHVGDNSGKKRNN